MHLLLQMLCYPTSDKAQTGTKEFSEMVLCLSAVYICRECVDTDYKLLFLSLEEERGRSPHVDIKVSTLFDTSIMK